MKKVFQYNERGKVISYSEGPNKGSLEVELTLTKSNEDKIKSKEYTPFIKNNKLVLEENQRANLK